MAENNDPSPPLIIIKWYSYFNISIHVYYNSFNVFVLKILQFSFCYLDNIFAYYLAFLNEDPFPQNGLVIKAILLII